MTKVIFFNGPPRCGKDTLTAMLMKNNSGMFSRLRMSRSLKMGVHTLLGMNNEWGEMAEERFDKVKDQERIEFFHQRPRDIYIACAEQFIKKYFSQDVFGHIWLRQYYELNFDLTTVIVPDTGFYDETLPITQAIGRENCILVRIYRDGCDYSNDSRGYVKDICNNEIDIYNKDGRIDSTYNWLRFELERLKVFADANAD